MGALKGKTLETTVLASMAAILHIVKIPSGVRYTGGGEKIDIGGGRSRFLPRSCAMRSPVDFMGCTVGNGRWYSTPSSAI